MKRLIGLLLTLAILLCVLPGTCWAQEQQAEETYIVKYKDPPDDKPFQIVSAQELKVLLEQQALEWYEPDEEIPLHDPADVRFPVRTATHSWALELIHAGSALQSGYTGQGIRVGVIDSGINPHPDLAENLVPGACYISDTTVSYDTADNYGHGTRVAGLIAGHNAEFNTGAAPGVTLVPLKCTDGKAVKVSAICRAVYAGVDEYDCDILNMSLGVSRSFEALQEAISYAQSRGVLVVAAVGNSGNAAVYYPAGFDGVLGIGALESTGTVYSKSNRNNTVFLTAPGVDVLTTHSSGGYTTATGTSFAVPLVTAAAADLMSADPSISTETVSSLLQSGATDAGDAGWDTAYGYGIVDIEASLLRLEELQDDPPEPPAPQPKVNPFTDVAEDKFYYEPILWAYYHNPQITAGTSETSFSPENPCTRAQIVTFLWRAAGSPEPETSGNPFEDVQERKYYYKAVLWAAETGVTTGTGKTMFSPDDTCTRAQVVTFLWRFAGSPEPTASTSPFEDVPEGEYYTKAVLWAAETGVTAGTSETTFSPDDGCTRAQSVTFLYRLIGEESSATRFTPAFQLR